jgi:hypothetical protein
MRPAVFYSMFRHCTEVSISVNVLIVPGGRGCVISYLFRAQGNTKCGQTWTDWVTVYTSIFKACIAWPRTAVFVGGRTECLHSASAVEGSRGDKGEAACTVLYSCIVYVTNQWGREFQNFAIGSHLSDRIYEAIRPFIPHRNLLTL